MRSEKKWLATVLFIFAFVILACGSTSNVVPEHTSTPVSEIIDIRVTEEVVVQDTIISVSTDTPAPLPTYTEIPSATTAIHLPVVTDPEETKAAPTDLPITQTIGSVEVHYLDVGQGDAILIKGSDGKAALIDGGDSGTGVVSYLQSVGITHLEWIVATHPHSDHIGGLTDVLESIPVSKVITGGQIHTTLTFERFLDAIDSAQADYVEVKRGDIIQLGDINLLVLNPTSSASNDLNNSSVVLRFVHGQTIFLFMGDAEKQAELGILTSELDIKADILKVGHHGSRSSTTSEFLVQVKPSVAIYTAGSGNTYGHPHGETLVALNSVGAEVFGTDVNGTVVVTSDGLGYSVNLSTDGQPITPPPTLVPTSLPDPAPIPLSLEIVSVTSPISPGDKARLEVQTIPGASCGITVHYKSGPSSAEGLEMKYADTNSSVSWTWTVGSRTTPGNWRIVIDCSNKNEKISIETSFEVR